MGTVDMNRTLYVLLSCLKSTESRDAYFSYYDKVRDPRKL